MSRRCGCATSRFTLYPKTVCTLWLYCFLLFPSAAEAGLYTASDQIILLTPENVKSVLVNSTAAVLAEFYASWCGHCIAFSPVFKSLARDIKEWKPAVDLAAIDCSAAENRKVCISYSVRGYPTIKFFHAYSKANTLGQTLQGYPRNVQGLRQKIIESLETHGEPWPPACPPLEPISQAEVDSFFETNNVQHLALIFEEANSYIGRELTLDLLQFENIAVRRVLNTGDGLVTKLGVTDFPSCYLYYPGGNFTRLNVKIEARSFYSYALRRLQGVVRSGKPRLESIQVLTNSTEDTWRPFNRSRVYMADLESTLHYSLRVEVASYPIINGDALISLKRYIAVLTKYFPGRPVVMNLLRSLNSWLQNQSGSEVSYQAFKEILDNSAQSSDTALPEGEIWVGCQGSKPHLRGFPCGVWTLFHVLTVQAKNAGGSDPLEVLTAMRNYVHSFFGCKHCSTHFEVMAQESVMEVNTLSSAVLWLWSRHNRVNNRIAGDLSEDPNFPKIQWPPPELCPACHTVKQNGDHKWNQEQVLPFLLNYFSSDRILSDYLEDESHVLTKQREKQARQQLAVAAMEPATERLERKTRETSDFLMNPLTLQPTAQEEEDDEEEEEEEPQDEAVAGNEEEGGEEEAAAASEMGGGKSSDPNQWAKREMNVGHSRGQAHRKPSIVGMRIRDMQEDIVDLDSFVNQNYKAKTLQVAPSTRIKHRTLQRKEEQEPGPVFGLGMELDAGVGMVGLQPMEEGFDLDVGQKKNWLRKRELTGPQLSEEELNVRGRWMSMLSIGFSKADVSLCVILYFLSSMCLLAMYLFFKNHLRLRRVKVSLP